MPVDHLHTSDNILINFNWDYVITGCPYNVYGKTFERETFTFRVENGYSLETFHGGMLIDVHSNQQGHNSWENICD